MHPGPRQRPTLQRTRHQWLEILPPSRPQKQPKPDTPESEPLFLPTLVDRPSALTALNQVIQALSEGRIKLSLGSTLLHGIKIAARLINEMEERGIVMPAAPVIARPQSIAPRPSAPSLSRLAASGAATQAFNPMRHPHPSFSDDPSTDRLVRELLAQSHEMSRTPMSRTQAQAGNQVRTSHKG